MLSKSKRRLWLMFSFYHRAADPRKIRASANCSRTDCFVNDGESVPQAERAWGKVGIVAPLALGFIFFQ